MLLKERYREKLITWFDESSPVLPSNLGMSEGNLVDIGGQVR